MFRLLIGCLAIVGLLTVLVVGGCVGLIAFGVKKGIEVPAHARRERIEALHGALLADLRGRLGRPDGLAGLRRPPALVAIRVRSGTDADKDVDLLAMRPLGWQGHTLLNGSGIGAVEAGGRRIDCLVYEMEVRGQAYWVYLADMPAPVRTVERT